MPRIKRDQFGLFVAGGGYKTRPLQKTFFQEGQVVKTHHRGGSCSVGVGKSPECKRGEYLENWITTGTTTNEKMEPEEEERQISWYKVFCSNLSLSEFTDRERELAEEYQKLYIGRAS